MAKRVKNVSELSTRPNVPVEITPVFWHPKYSYETLIFIFTFALYLNSIPNGYSLDDELVTINHRLTSKGVSAIPDIFTSPYYQDESGYSYEYRPIVLVSFAIEHQFFGDNPYVSHFFNVILYALACVLLFKVLSLLFINYSPLFSVAVSLLFAAHTAHTEAVSSIKNRDEILGLLFSLGAFLFVLKYIREKKIIHLFPAFVFIILALLSKLTFAVFAIIIPISVVMFYPAGFSSLILLTSILLVPSVYFQSSLSGFTKLAFLICGLCSIGGLYFIKNVRNYIGFFNTYGRKYFKLNKKDFDFGDTPNASDRGQFFKDINPALSKFHAKNWVLVLVPLVIVFTGFFLHWLALNIIGLILLVIFFYRREEEINWLTYCAFCIILIARFNYLNYFHESFYVDFFSVPLVFLLIYGNRKFFIPTLLTITVLLFFQIAYFTDSENYVTPLIYLLCVFALRYNYGWVVTVFFSGITVWAFARDVSHHSDYLEAKLIGQIPFLLIIILIINTYFKKNIRFIIRLYIVAALFLILLPQYSSPPLQVGNIIVNAANKANPVLMSTKQDRPILYLEEIIDYNNTPISERLGTSLEILYYYAYKVVLPYPLSFYYGYRFIKPMKITDAIPLISLIIHLVLLIAALYFIKKDAKISFGIFLYLASIALFSNYFFGVPGMIADRFLLVPSLGWLIFLASALLCLFKADLPDKTISLATIPSPIRYSFIVILLFYSTLTFSRNLDWKNYITLFRHDIKYVDESAQAHNLLALRLMKNSIDTPSPDVQLSMRQEALMHFKKSIEIYPYFFNTNYDAARVSAILNQPDSAVFYFNQAIKIDSSNIDPYISCGKIRIEQGKFAEAAPYFEYAVKNRPLNYVGYENLSFIYYSLKEYAQSIAVNKSATKLFPSLPGPYINIARTFFTVNETDSARDYVQAALKIDPGNKIANSLLMQLQKK